MGDVRGICRSAAALVVVLVAGLVTVVTGSPATAAYPYPDQCVEQRSGYSVRLDRPYDSRIVISDLDVTVPWDSQLRYRQVELVNGQRFSPEPQQRWRLSAGRGFLDQGGLYEVTFDDQAALSQGEPVPPGTGQVRVRPVDPLQGFQRVTSPDWYVSVDEQQTPDRFFTMTITWSDCDADHDQLGDRTVDNCVGVYNPDRRDSDGDGIGDACDADNDNDGVPDVSDNCPALANRDQLDWDGDGRGNACDDTPGTAPAPPVGQPTTTPTTTPQPPTPGCTASCAYPRSVVLQHVKKKHRLTGKVTSSAIGCTRQVAVTLWQQRKKTDRRLVVLTSRTNGTFRTKAPRKAGRYYVTVGSDTEPLCGADRSRSVRIERR